MDYIYEILPHAEGNIIIRSSKTDSVTVSFGEDAANPDYQKYLVDTDGGLPEPKPAKPAPAPAEKTPNDPAA